MNIILYVIKWMLLAKESAFAYEHRKRTALQRKIARILNPFLTHLMLIFHTLTEEAI